MRLRARGVVAVWAGLTLAASVAIAQERDRIEPDRPDAADSTSTVPAGALQIESGRDDSGAKVGGRPTERRFALGTLLRAGLTERLEVRLDTVSAKYRDRTTRCAPE